MKNQLLSLLAFLLFIFCGSAHSRSAPSLLLAQEQGDISGDFDDSVLKDIEDIESEDEEDMDEEDMDEEDMDEEDMDEEDMDEEDMDEEDMDEEDMDEEDMDEEDMDEEDMDEEDMDEEDMDEEDMDEEDMDEEDMDEEDMDEEDMDEEDMDEEDMDEEDMDEEDMGEEDMDEEDMDEEDMDEEDMDEEDMDDLQEDPAVLPLDEDISLEEDPAVLPSDEDISLEEDPAVLPSDEDISLEEDPAVLPSDEDISLEEEDDSEALDEPPVFVEDSQKFSSEGLNVIGNIRYVAALDQIVIDSSEVISYQVHHNRKNNQIIIEILQARLSENLKWPYVLKDFNTGFGLIQADSKDEKTVRILIQVKENYPLPQVTLGETGETMKVSFHGVSGKGLPVAGGVGSSTRRSLLPPQTLENFYFGNQEFSGHPLSFHVIDAPVKQVLRFISEESGLNMVIDETVKGTITLKLENVPWDQAFLTILQVKNLSYIGQGNVVMISTLDALDQKAKKLKEMVEQSKTLAPFQTKMISVSYANISEVASKIQPFLTQATGKGGKKGEMIVHDESGTLVITDTEKVIEKVKKLVGFLDKPPRQVMIEARIVDAVENFTENFGLTWSITGSTPFSINVSGFLEDLRSSVSGAGLNIRGNGTSYGLNISGLPVVGSLSATLNLAETKGYARVVSSPKVVTLSGKKASITRNAPILITKSVDTDLSGGGVQRETREPLDIKISLDVTPHITPSGSVFMSVQITRSSPGPVDKRQGDPIAITRSAQTEVLVKNGHTVVIGGIYQYDEIGGNTGLPFLRHIPFLKFLFSDTAFSTTKNELLVFLTPKLIDEP